MVIINKIDTYSSSIEPQPPTDAKWLIEFFDDQFHNKIYVLPSNNWPSLIENGIMDLDYGTSYSDINDLSELESILNNIIKG